MGGRGGRAHSVSCSEGRGGAGGGEADQGCGGLSCQLAEAGDTGDPKELAGRPGKSDLSDEYRTTSWTATHLGLAVSGGGLADAYTEGPCSKRQCADCREVSDVCMHINNTKDFELCRDTVYIKISGRVHSFYCVGRVSEPIQR